jgi:hypothetical protein
MLANLSHPLLGMSPLTSKVHYGFKRFIRHIVVLYIFHRLSISSISFTLVLPRAAIIEIRVVH